MSRYYCYRDHLWQVKWSGVAACITSSCLALAGGIENGWLNSPANLTHKQKNQNHHSVTLTEVVRILTECALQQCGHILGQQMGQKVVQYDDNPLITGPVLENFFKDFFEHRVNQLVMMGNIYISICILSKRLSLHCDRNVLLEGEVRAGKYVWGQEQRKSHPV